MDIPNSKNKMIEESVNKAEAPTTIRAVSVQKNEYFFPGGGKWKPMYVVATTREDAEATHRERRQPVNPEAKVEEKKETNNE